MQSPKFKFLKNDLSDTFAKDLLDEEWRKRVRYQIRKQLVFDPLEYRDYHEARNEMIAEVRSRIISGSYTVHQSKRYLVEKSGGLCRQMTLVHPHDLLVLERLSRSLYFELRKKAPSKSAFFEPDDGNFKKGFQQIDFQYGSFASWRKFQKAVFGFSRENKYLVVTDVANFYDFINFNHLRNVISDKVKIRESILDLLIFLLNRLTWLPDYMPLTHVGMPQVETSATRVLANAMLYEVDHVCETASVDNYARFMDDMDIGVSSMSLARQIVRDVDLTLQSRQLRLNSSKTRILTQKDAFDYFCISENEYLARADDMLKKLKAFKAAKRLLKKSLFNRYEKWLQRTAEGSPSSDSPFRRANGSKIHKYVMRLVYETRGSIPDNDLLWLIENDPGMRATAFMYLARTSKPNQVLAKLHSLLLKEVFVDDAAFQYLAGFMLHARLKPTHKCQALARDCIKFMESRGQLGLLCAMQVALKFSYPAEILALVSRNKNAISVDFWLLRLAGSFFVRFVGNPLALNMYLDLIRTIDSEPMWEVQKYFADVSSSPNLKDAVKHYSKAINNTYPQRIYFPKVLVLIAIFSNANLSVFSAELRKIHAKACSDPFYVKMGLK